MTEKIETETRELFKKWVRTLTDDDVDRILEIKKEKSLEEKLHYYLSDSSNHMLLKGQVAKELALIATKHFANKQNGFCNHFFKSDCHGIEMIVDPDGKEWAVGGTKTKSRWLFDPWCGNAIRNDV